MKNKTKLLILGIVILGSINSFAGWAKYRDMIIDTVKETSRDYKENSYYDYENDDYYYYNGNYYQNPYKWNSGNCRYGC